MGEERLIKGGVTGLKRTARDDVAVAVVAAASEGARIPAAASLRGMKRPRLSTRRWETVRRVVLDRDGWRCQRCGRYGRMEVHHTDGDPSHADPSRLLTLCRGCHIELHRPPVTPAEAAWRAMVREA